MLNCHISSLSSVFCGSNTAPRKGPTDIYLHLLLQARTQFLSQHRWCSKSDWALPVWPPIAWQFGKNDMSFTKHWNTGRPPLSDFMNIPYFHSNKPSFERWVPVESSDRFTPDFIPGPARDAKVAIKCWGRLLFMAINPDQNLVEQLPMAPKWSLRSLDELWLETSSICKSSLSFKWNLGAWPNHEVSW